MEPTASRFFRNAFSTPMFRAALLVAALSPLVTGCGGRSRVGGFQPGPPKPPPGFPVPQDVPIDAQLVAAATTELKSQLKSEWPVDRTHAIEGLQHVVGAKAAQEIIAGLSDPAQMVRFAACMAVGELKLDDARSKLNTMLNDPDGRVQVAVRFALHRIGDYSHTRDLETFARSTQPRVRGATAMVLGRLGEPSGKGILRALRGDIDPTGDLGKSGGAVRQQAEEALFLLDDARGREAIIGYTASQHPDDVMFAMRALAEKRDPKLRDYARAKLTDDYVEVALTAALAMGAMKADDGYGVALLGMKDQDANLGPRRRQLAAAAFGAIGRTDAQQHLAVLLKDSNSEVRAAAATAILRIAKDPRRFDRAGKIIP